MSTPIYSVLTEARNTWRVVRLDDEGRATVHMTTDRLEAVRMRDELEKADKRAFYQGLLIGRGEVEAQAREGVICGS